MISSSVDAMGNHVVDMSSNPTTTMIMTHGLAGNAEAHKLLSAMSTPLVFTGLTEAYLQTFPITLTVIGLAIAASVGYFGSTLFGKVVK